MCGPRWMRSSPRSKRSVLGHERERLGQPTPPVNLVAQVAVLELEHPATSSWDEIGTTSRPTGVGILAAWRQPCTASEPAGRNSLAALIGATGTGLFRDTWPLAAACFLVAAGLIVLPEAWRPLKQRAWRTRRRVRRLAPQWLEGRLDRRSGG